MHRSRVTRDGRKSYTTNAEREPLCRVLLNNWIRGIMIEDTISAARWQHPRVVSLYVYNYGTFLRD